MLDKDHPPLDVRLARLALRQHGVVSGRQLRALGLSRQAISQRVEAGRLHRLHRDVFAVGHRRLTSKARWLAAVLATGSKGVLSHTHALALWEMRSRPSGPVNVTVAARGRRRRNQLRYHCVRHLEPEDVCVRDGIPVTTVPRTLLDVAEVVPFQALRHAVEAAERLELLDLHEIEAVIARNPGRRGAKLLMMALQLVPGLIPETRSQPERDFLSIIRAAGLPEPRCNVLVHGELVDYYWPDSGLVVEVDSYGFHRTRSRFEADRRRDAKLMLEGIRVLRITQERMRREPERVVTEIRALLGL